jgi:hypothetical protein
MPLVPSSLFLVSSYSQGCGGCILIRLHTGIPQPYLVKYVLVPSGVIAPEDISQMAATHYTYQFYSNLFPSVFTFSSHETALFVSVAVMGPRFLIASLAVTFINHSVCVARIARDRYS